MGISGIHATDLVFYTNKGILIVHVEFNAEFWQRILNKLQLFFAKFMVPELLTGNILCEMSVYALMHTFISRYTCIIIIITFFEYT